MKKGLCLLCLALACAHRAPAAEIHVPANQPTIQAAIDAAINGDHVVIAPGTYFESINTLGKLITLRSTNPLDPAVVAATVIDGAGAGPFVTVTGFESAALVFDGLTFANGGGPNVNGGAMYIEDSSPSLQNCVFKDNVCTLLSRGGAIYVRDGDPDMFNCRFEGNRARYGGAIRLDITSNSTIIGCQFVGNIAEDDGGAISKSRGSSIIDGCSFDGNEAGLRGGALYLFDSSCTVRNCTFTNGYAGTDGGGVHLGSDESTVLTSLFNNNSCGARGGGVHVGSDSGATVSVCDFRGNLAAINGGGLAGEEGNVSVNGSAFCANWPDHANNYNDLGGNTFNPWCFNFFPDEWLWFDPFEWDDVLTELGYENLAQVTFEQAAGHEFSPFDDPLNAMTDNGIFMPCDIPALVCFKSNTVPGGIGGEAPRGADGLIVYGPDLGAPSTSIASNEPDDGFDIVFPQEIHAPDMCSPSANPGVLAVGLQLCAFKTGEVVLISLYDERDLLIGTTEVMPDGGAPCGFLGIAVMNGAVAGGGEGTRIGRINIYSEFAEQEGVAEVTVYGFEPCLADLTGDDTVDTVDLLALLGAWGTNPGGPPDFDGDLNVGTADLLFMLANWGNCP